MHDTQDTSDHIENLIHIGHWGIKHKDNKVRDVRCDWVYLQVEVYPVFALPNTIRVDVRHIQLNWRRARGTIQRSEFLREDNLEMGSLY